ncbi:MAG: Ldh family oxidoreductase [Elusimicrobia bacterium]|nr:Ldh family oxidoreductase [Elusimicrobiota bacterium]
MKQEKGLKWVKADLLERFMKDVFKGLGVPPAEAAVCADVLITADKLGIESHGVSRLKPIYYDRIKDGILSPRTRFEIVRQGPAVAVVDGHNGMGHVIGKRAMELAIRKARRCGIAMVAVRNSTHYGIAGYHALLAAKAGMIGLTGTNARPSVAPTFGVEAMMGTNPITFAIPTDEKFPFLLDCATSITQRGKIEVLAKLGQKMPKGWVIGSRGEAKTDSLAVLNDIIAGTAALVTVGGIGEEMAGYKGYGYATAVEILSSALQQGAYMKMLSGRDAKGRKIPYPIGHFFIAIDVAAFTAPAAFKRTAGAILRELRASKKMPGARRIYTAGEKEHLALLRARKKGVPLNEETQREVLAMREELGLSKYKFPF